MNEVTNRLDSLLRAANRVLIVTHHRPDGDALGSAFGLREILRDAGKFAQVLLSEAVPYRYLKLCTDYWVEFDPAELAQFDAIVVLDCAAKERIALPKNCSADEFAGAKTLNFDHHRYGAPMAAAAALIDPERSSTCEVLTDWLLTYHWSLSPRAATLLLTGMMTDTGCFRFANTTGNCLRTAAKLLDAGAHLAEIVNAVFFSKSFEQMQFENQLMSEELRLACDRRFAYACIKPEMCQKYRFNPLEDEGLIDLLRELDSVVIAMLIRREKANCYKISLRSKDAAYPVGPLARQLGGGGHDLAAGATLSAASFAEVEQLMLKHVAALLN